jgi:hypothetical protein
MITLGKVVKSNSHTDYVGQVYSKHEAPYVPVNTDYAFGTFVTIDMNGSGALVGLIYDTVLLNPDFGRLGPRLSNENDLALFSPDYLNERATLIGITVIGQMDTEGARQGVPPIAANGDALIKTMDVDAIRTFHQANGRFQLAYVPLLLQLPNPLARQLAMNVVRGLGALLPEQEMLLTVIADDLLWQLQIQGMGAR